MANPARLAGVGLFIIAGLLLFAIGLFMIGDRQMAFARKFTLYTEFNRITGLQPGAVIRVAGAKAGSIKNIETPQSPTGKFRVEMEIAESLHPLIRTDSVASIMTEGLVGGGYLGIATGSEQAPAAAAGSTIPSREPFEIADLLSGMADTVTKVNQTIDEMRGEIEHAVESIGDTVDNANDLMNAVSDDVKTIASAGARISGDVAEITNQVRDGKGTIGKLFTDDELYSRSTEIVKNVQQLSGEAREVVAHAKAAIDQLEAKNGPVQGLTADVTQTLASAREAMAGLAENMDALKHNFLFRGYFKSRGYFDLADISPADYRAGVLTNDNHWKRVRIWLGADVLFEPGGDTPGAIRLTEAGRARLDSAIAPYLDRLADSIVVIEGYAQGGTRDEEYVASRRRASLARDYLIGRFHLDASATGLMPLGSRSEESPRGTAWDGIAIAIFLQSNSN